MRLLYALPIVMLPNALHLPPNLGIAASIVLLVAAAVFGERDPPHLAPPGYLTPPLAGLFLALLVGYVNAHWSNVSNAGEDLMRAKYALAYPLLYIAYRRCGLDLKATRQMLVLVMVVAAGAGLEAVIQGQQFNLVQFTDEQRATGPFGDINMANRAGVFYAMFLPLLAAVALQPRLHRLARLLALVGAVILAAAVLFTFSRQAYLIALLGILVLLVYRGVPLAALAVGLLMVAVGLLPDSMVQRMMETRQVGSGGMVSYDASTSSRLEIWRGAIAMLADHPAGVGLGRFRDFIGDYTNHPGRDAHNAFVLTLAECGPFGLAMMLWLFWRLWGLARKLRRAAVGGDRDLPEARALSLGFTVAVIATALGNMYGSPYVEGLVMYNFFILCGLMERYGILQAHEAAVLVTGPDHPLEGVAPALRFPRAARALPGLAATTRSLRPR
jgi:O-antigen ligase